MYGKVMKVCTPFPIGKSSHITLLEPAMKTYLFVHSYTSHGVVSGMKLQTLSMQT